MIKRQLIVSISIFFLILYTESLSAQNVSFTPNVGVSKTFGDGHTFYTSGFTIASNQFYSLSKRISVGGRLAYNRIFPEGDRLARVFETSDFSDVNTSGALSIIEVVPSIQIAASTSSDHRTVNIAFQIGAGLFFLKNNIGADYSLPTQEPGASRGGGIKINDNWETKPGLQFGLALDINRRFLIEPLYTRILNNGNTFSSLPIDISNYFSLNIGFRFGN